MKLPSLFEGFFDFLSAMEYFKINEPRITAVILNSTTNLKRFINNVDSNTKVWSYLDNDDSGNRAKTKLIDSGYELVDVSKILYPSFKDFNEYWVSTNL